MINNNQRRIVSIDALRGITMGLMILSGAIASTSGFPSWMFHCQVPPPDFTFHPEIRGITWVDLVFPFFLFSMGTAFPFAMRRRLSKGKSNTEIIGFLIKRWFTLVLFSLVIANAECIYSWEGPDLVKGSFVLLVWTGMFLSLMRTRSKVTNLIGYIFTAGLMAAGLFYFKLPMSIHHTDIIIMILSSTALFGGLIWLFTRQSILLRTLIWLGIIGIKALTSYTPLSFPSLPGWLNWVFDWGFLQYLILVLPASAVGDLLYDRSRQRAPRCTSPFKESWAAIIALAAALFQLFGLYLRATVIDMGVTMILFGIFILLNTDGKLRNTFYGCMGFLFMIIGIAFDFPDNGIAKDYCNLSYLFVTGGMATLATYFLLFLEDRGWEGSFFARAGQNPMIAYTICWFVISPLLYATGLLGHIDRLCVGSVVWGLLRGALLTALTYILTGFFTRIRVFWRS